MVNSGKMAEIWSTKFNIGCSKRAEKMESLWVSVVRPFGIRYRNTSKLLLYHFKNSRYGPKSSEAAVTHSWVWRRKGLRRKITSRTATSRLAVVWESFVFLLRRQRKMFAFREHFQTSLVTYFLEGPCMLQSLRFCFCNNASETHLCSSSIAVILKWEMDWRSKVKTPEAPTSNNMFSISLTLSSLRGCDISCFKVMVSWYISMEEILYVGLP